MKTKITLPIVILLFVLLSVGVVQVASQTGGEPEEVMDGPAVLQAAIGSAFSYQGRLEDGGNPADGPYDFQFSLYDAASGGTQVGSTVTKNNLTVSSGLFSTDLDFGVDAFSGGQALWLQMAVRPGASAGAYTTLSPRTTLLANPYAMVSGRVLSHNQNNALRASLGVDASEGDGELLLIGANGNENVWIAGAGGGNLGGASFFNSAGATGASIGVTTSNANEFGQVSVYGPNGKPNVRIRPPSSNRNHGFIQLFDANGDDQMALWVNDSGNGEVRTDIVQILGGSDLAEPFVVNGMEKLESGMVVTLDPDNPGQLRLATTAYDPLVAGIISGAGGVNPGIIMQQEDREIAGQTYPVALTGQVYVWAVGPVQVGDLLTSSDTPGYAMAATDKDRAFGSVIGKAMTSLDNGAGLVLVLVTLQ